MMKIICLIISSLVALNVYAVDRPFERNADIYFNELTEDQFQKLENDWGNNSKEMAFISDGQPMLSAFYGGVSGCVFLGCALKTDADWGMRKDKLSAWKKKFPHSVAAKVASAYYFVEYGWYLRGTGYSSSVSDKQFQLFNENVEIGRNELLKIKTEANNDAGWYAAMLQVAISQSWEQKEFDRVYSEAIAKFPYYFPLDFTKANYMAPRWNGSIQEFKKFIDEAVTRTHDKMGEEMYTRLNWSSWDRHMFENGQADWPRMKQGFQQIIKKYPDAWNLNNFAKFACMAGDFKTVSEIIRLINGTPLAAAWFNSKKYYEQCVNHAKAFD